MNGWLDLERDGTRLAVRDFGGGGPPVLLLHGLAGQAEEWDETAEALAPRHRVLALDARGHGRSERRPDDVSRAAHIADAAFAIERLELGPVALVGQSLGGHAALLVAAEHPALVRGLVVAEASPLAAPDPARFAADAAARLAGWPDPRFDVDVMERTLREAVALDVWDAWERIACPALVVRGERGTLAREVADAMVERLPRARLVEVADAGHDLHLDQPAAWAETLAAFLAALD